MFEVLPTLLAVCRCALGAWRPSERLATFTRWEVMWDVQRKATLPPQRPAGCGSEPTCRFAPSSSLLLQQQSHKQEMCIHLCLLVHNVVRDAWIKAAAGVSADTQQRASQSRQHRPKALMINTVDRVYHLVSEKVRRKQFSSLLSGQNTNTTISAIMEIIFCSNLLFAFISLHCARRQR